MSEPKRIQRKRTKGWRMPENTVYVGRPGIWGNPYVVGKGFPRIQTAAEAVERYRAKCYGPVHYAGTSILRGKDLACWCPLDQPCHADVLLEWANR